MQKDIKIFKKNNVTSVVVCYNGTANSDIIDATDATKEFSDEVQNEQFSVFNRLRYEIGDVKKTIADYYSLKAEAEKLEVELSKINGNILGIESALHARIVANNGNSIIVLADDASEAISIEPSSHYASRVVFTKPQVIK